MTRIPYDDQRDVSTNPLTALRLLAAARLATIQGSLGVPRGAQGAALTLHCLTGLADRGDSFAELHERTNWTSLGTVVGDLIGQEGPRTRGLLDATRSEAFSDLEHFLDRTEPPVPIPLNRYDRVAQELDDLRAALGSAPPAHSQLAAVVDEHLVQILIPMFKIGRLHRVSFFSDRFAESTTGSLFTYALRWNAIGATATSARLIGMALSVAGIVFTPLGIGATAAQSMELSLRMLNERRLRRRTDN